MIHDSSIMSQLVNITSLQYNQNTKQSTLTYIKSFRINFVEKRHRCRLTLIRFDCGWWWSWRKWSWWWWWGRWWNASSDRGSWWSIRSRWWCLSERIKRTGRDFRALEMFRKKGALLKHAIHKYVHLQFLNKVLDSFELMIYLYVPNKTSRMIFLDEIN